MSSTVAGTADPPTMNRWVTTAPTIVGMSRSAPNAAQDGTRRHGRDDLDRAGHVAEPLPDADRIEQRDQFGRAGQLQSAGEQEHAGKGNLREPERHESDPPARDCGRLVGGDGGRERVVMIRLLPFMVTIRYSGRIRYQRQARKTALLPALVTWREPSAEIQPVLMVTNVYCVCVRYRQDN